MFVPLQEIHITHTARVIADIPDDSAFHSSVWQGECSVTRRAWRVACNAADSSEPRRPTRAYVWSAGLHKM